MLPLLLLPCSAAVLFTPDANCSRVYGSSDRDIWWECSRSLRQKLYPPPSAHQQAAGPEVECWRPFEFRDAVE